MNRLQLIGATVVAAVAVSSPVYAAADYVSIAGGSFASVLPDTNSQATSDVSVVSPPVVVAPFQLRSEPVTNDEFLAFVVAHPEWRRDQIPSLFAESRYLSHWPAADSIGDAAASDQPVIQVSWFAAQAFCGSESARLPTWHEWEFAAAADETRVDARTDPAWRARILGWYSKPSNTPLPTIGGMPNAYGIRDLHELVWEWVDDAGALLVASDSRDQDDPDRLKFCGAGALQMKDRDNYAVLMRIALLSSLKAANVTANLGFRCTKTDLRK